jgi:hypothetical protein
LRQSPIQVDPFRFRAVSLRKRNGPVAVGPWIT